MTKSTSTQRFFIALGIPVLLLSVVLFVSKSVLLGRHSESMSLVITLDLLLTIPFIYFLLIRKTSIPNTTVAPLMILGLVIGSFILPTENQGYLNLFKTWALPVIELSIVTFIFLKVRKTITHFKAQKTSDIDFFSTLKATTKNLFPAKVAAVCNMEIAVFYYGFIAWKKKIQKPNEFTYHKNGGTITLLGAVMFLILVETAILHILLVRWSYVAAWVLTGLSIYSAIQIHGFLRSILKRPICIEEDSLNLRYGIINEAKIDYTNIQSVELTSTSIEFDKNTRALSPIKSMEGHNIIIHLKTPSHMNGLYGTKKTVKSIVFTVDNKEEFKRQLETKIQ